MQGTRMFGARRETNSQFQGLTLLLTPLLLAAAGKKRPAAFSTHHPHLPHLHLHLNLFAHLYQIAMVCPGASTATVTATVAVLTVTVATMM
jgi:hypothetical protein